MEDEFMRGLRATPPLEFSARLRAELRERRRSGGVLERRPGGHRGLFVGTAAVLAAVLLLLPVVRTSAQAFLNLFRVVNFTAVPIDVSRIQGLSERGLLPALIGEQVEVLVDPGPPQVFATPSDASAFSGIHVRVPAVVPPALVMLKTEVTGERQLRVAADTRRLQAVLDALGIADARVPAELTGQVATLRIPPVVAIIYANGSNTVRLLQARSPEVTGPSGIDVAALGEIGLRIAGLDRSAAHTFAQAIDWRATLIVPVPAGVSAFRQVDVQGQRGLYVESTDRKELRAVAWSKGGIVYGLTGALNAGTLLQMADSVQ